MTKTDVEHAPLYQARRGRVDHVDVPEFGLLVVGGHGAPGGAAFAAAVGTLYPIAYAAHFLVRKEYGEAPRVMPLEALWWTEDGLATPVDPEQWRWAAMIMQPDPIDELTIEAAIERAREKALPGLGLLRYERWREGPAMQTLHVGPYDAEAPTIEELHAAIAAAGLRPRGRHHEIYLSDPRRCPPERLRTIIRQPVEPADEPAGPAGQGG